MRRFDFVFSYWILTWWILYMIGLVPFNPKLFLILGIIENIFGIFFLTYPNLIYFMIINFFIKVIPLYLIWNTKLKSSDNYFGIGLLIVHLIWLRINKQPIIKVRTPLTDYLRDKNLHS